MTVSFDHCVIAVSDWEAANAFYRDVVGAVVGAAGHDVGTLVARTPVTPGNSDLCFVWDGPIEVVHTNVCSRLLCLA